MSRQESASDHDHGKMTDPKERPPADSAYARAIRDILATPKTQKPRRFDAWATASKDAQSKTEQKSTSNVQADQAAKQAGRRDEKPFDPDQTPARFKFDKTIR